MFLCVGVSGSGGSAGAEHQPGVQPAFGGGMAFEPAAKGGDQPGGEGELILLETNTQPGMTETSLVPELAAYAGLSFGGLVRWMVEEASCDR
jgi:hypothetical protein